MGTPLQKMVWALCAMVRREEKLREVCSATTDFGSKVEFFVCLRMSLRTKKAHGKFQGNGVWEGEGILSKRSTHHLPCRHWRHQEDIYHKGYHVLAHGPTA